MESRAAAVCDVNVTHEHGRVSIKSEATMEGVAR